MKNKKLTIIAGPCSVDKKNVKEIYKISKIEVINKKGKRQKAIAGTRIVGLKSRTALDNSGDGMGIDYKALMKNLAMLQSGKNAKEFKTTPSIKIAKQVSKDTGMIIASEIMMPLVQLPLYQRELKGAQFMPWNPAVEQLGWQIKMIGEYAKRNRWLVGLKNCKWIGGMEKVWIGLTKFACARTGMLILIHRGVDAEDKGDYRNLPVHKIACRVKQASGAKLWFDPSHAYGPKMRGHIVPETIKAMKMKNRKDEYLYDGILIETGTSKTDTDQHISIDELGELVNKLAKFRDLVKPKK